MFNYRSTLILLCFLLAFWSLDQKAVFAGSRFQIIETLDFGTLMVAPYGGSVVLSAEELNKPLQSYTGEDLLRMSGGRLGKIRYRPSKAGEEILIQYEEVLVENGMVKIKDMHEYSTTRVIAEDTSFHYIEMGALLRVEAGFRGRVTGSVPVTIMVINE